MGPTGRNSSFTFLFSASFRRNFLLCSQIFYAKLCFSFCRHYIVVSASSPSKEGHGKWTKIVERRITFFSILKSVSLCASFLANPRAFQDESSSSFDLVGKLGAQYFSDFVLQVFQLLLF